MTLSEVVTRCRELSGLDQQEFAKSIGLKTKQAISNYESGRDRPSFKVLERMLARAGIELDDCVVFWDPAMKQSREKENEEARAITEDLLRSPVRDELIAFLRASVPSAPRPRDRAAPHQRKGHASGERDRT